MWRWGTILVTGPAGAGKSTQAAKLLLELDRQGWSHVVMDREMAADQMVETFERAGAGRDLLKRLVRIEGTTEWRAALDVAEAASPDVVLVDSLDRWAPREADRRELLERITCPETGLGARALVVVVAHYARAGHVRGTTIADHGADAVVEVTKTHVTQTKCRWSPPRAIRRR